MFALVLNREGDRMPTGNEFVYLLYFFKGWHRHFLEGDWTFQEATAGHAVFNYSLGWLACILPLEAAAWLGRFACWAATILGLLRLGRNFSLPSWAVWTGVLLWLIQRQSPVTGEWMLGSFEAKTIAYPCLLFAIDAALNGRHLLAGILCGLAFSFHSAVGMWGGAAVGCCVLTQYPIRKTFVFSLFTILFSLPGLITSLPLVLGPHAITPAEAKYLVTVDLSDCLDPYGFPLTWMALLFVLPLFALMHAVWKKGDPKLRQLLILEFAMAGFFFFGLLARALGRFDWVELYSMRVYAVFAILFFYWRTMSVVVAIMRARQGHEQSPVSTQRVYSVPASIFFGALILFFSMPSPVLQLRDMIGTHTGRYLHAPREPEEPAISPARGDEIDFIAACRWVNSNSLESDVVIAPPWWNQAFYYIQRPLIANWHAPRYDRMTEWRARIESLVGDTTHLTIEDAHSGEMDALCWAHYATLSVDEIERLRRLPGYGGHWLITTGVYPYKLTFSSPTYRVYQLP